MNKQSTPRTGKTRKASSPATAAASAARRKTTTSRRASDASPATKPQVDVEIRHAMIAQAAYFRAEKRGFDGGGELDDWLEAEREISHILDE